VTSTFMRSPAITKVHVETGPVESDHLHVDSAQTRTG
jgi:hypothetical protein